MMDILTGHSSMSDWWLECQWCYHNIEGRCSSKGSPYFGRQVKGDVIRQCYRPSPDMMPTESTQTKLC